LADILFLGPWLALPTLSLGSRSEDRPSQVSKNMSEGKIVSTPAAAKLEKEIARLDQAPTLREVSMLESSLGPLIQAALQDLPVQPAQPRQEKQKRYLVELSRCLQDGDHACQRLLALKSLARTCGELAAMDFLFLFDTERLILHRFQRYRTPL
jgi:hypothetical protein